VESEDGDVTRLLAALQNRAASFSDLAPLIYDELRSLARRHLRRERSEHTLQATALVNEAWLRLSADRNLDWPSRAQFLAGASAAMRRVLVDHARKVKAERRGGGRKRMSLTVAEFAVADDPDRLLLLDEALERLAAEDARAAEIARLRLFAGLSPEETARALDVSVRTAGREWTYARTRLTELLQDTAPPRGEHAP